MWTGWVEGRVGMRAGLVGLRGVWEEEEIVVEGEVREMEGGGRGVRMREEGGETVMVVEMEMGEGGVGAVEDGVGGG
ncbi:hypothetical protein, partial [Kocuria rosea]|uniref:hypothetical protein n=1 Tax=Kocuria rosea TaxID=1275 RepID=UPI001643F5AC